MRSGGVEARCIDWWYVVDVYGSTFGMLCIEVWFIETQGADGVLLTEVRCAEILQGGQSVRIHVDQVRVHILGGPSWSEDGI
jgi:hypothetical protein